MTSTHTHATGVNEDNQYQPPPADADQALDRQTPVSEALLRSTIDSLEHLDEFLRRHANPSIREDLRAYAISQGWHPITGPNAFLDTISLLAHSLAHATTRPERTDADT
jgi:hypothetical protein